MAKWKICVVTGSRAEYGLLHDIMVGLNKCNDVDLQVVATGMHLSPEFGLTYKVIERDGFDIAAKVESLLSSDTAVGVTKSMGLGMIGFAEVFHTLSPNLVVLLGDRFEILSAALAAYIARIPIAHIGGGDVTEGAFDDSIRHSITKLASLHFVTHEAARRRVCQLGEDPAVVFDVGHPGIDRIRNLVLLSKEELAEILKFQFRTNNVLVTYHPVTLGPRHSSEEFGEVLHALHQLGEDVGIIFTKPNADPEGRLLANMIDDFVANHANAVSHTSLGQLYYFSAVQWVDAVVGNSSSGIYEVPSLKKPTVDIGDRQKGRMRGNSVVHCEPRAEDILHAIQNAFQLDCQNVANPYGDGYSSERILTEIMLYIPQLGKTTKRFCEVGN
ncbi:UDP-N-acetylglucosamine 2-epimerase [Alicyclobacillus fastidiosus]|uniref:UDP-N-acetylglucosamine 2-epimerase n=1 Tax=Alicyclobacillus fastidiosus TaxID=392011 RepID=A0ABY6ZA61_9BACL|nr:UDP-N-acetylglucosamine 2-epimerase [Alicyclobacillus fastidiosus]WAH39773.1 UDP-N-acetylglucosamine 2-epimerase [Alicyclobacillus fastidiosus]GMA61015.1 UDP-N-acetyl glucosamine 2-epimerase [Alicyclobacillus fastidiosus]